MKEKFIIAPEIIGFESLDAFKESFAIGEGDLVLTFADMEMGCRVIVCTKYGTGEPTDTMIDAILRDIGDTPYRRIIAIGGGTVIDIAKLLVDSSKKSCEEIFNSPMHKDRELIAVPTTCGTGSEVTSISIVAFEKKHTKIGRVDPALYPDKAVLIPELLAKLPYSVFITSSIDALIHAVESYLSPKATPLSKLFSKKAMLMILEGYKTAEAGKTPLDIEAYLTASLYAGIAFSNAGCGLVHAMSYPIGATYHLPHGAANAKVFMSVLKYYAQNADMSPLFGLLEREIGYKEAFADLNATIGRLLPPKSLGEMGMNAATCEDFAKSVIKEQQRLLANAYYQADENAIRNIYLNMLEEEQ